MFKSCGVAYLPLESRHKVCKHVSLTEMVSASNAGLDIDNHTEIRVLVTGLFADTKKAVEELA